MGSRLRRTLSKLVEIILISLLFSVGKWWSLVLTIGFVLYTDAIDGGQGLFKRVFGISVQDRMGAPITASQSAMRNFPFALIYLGLTIPYLGFILYVPAALIVCLEFYFVITLDRRILDYYAGTRVTFRPNDDWEKAEV